MLGGEKQRLITVRVGRTNINNTGPLKYLGISKMKMAEHISKTVENNALT